MKPYKVTKAKPVPRHKPRKPNLNHPNDSLTGTLENWEEAVFRNATLFKVVRKITMNAYERYEFPTYPEALIQAAKLPQYMLYAVTAEGRSFCVPRPQWIPYLEIWEQRTSS